MRHIQNKITSPALLIVAALSLQACALTQGLLPQSKARKEVSQAPPPQETSLPSNTIGQNDISQSDINPNDIVQPAQTFAQDKTATSKPINANSNFNTSTDLAFQQNPRYKNCLANIQKDSQAGRAEARQWVNDGGGAMAIHCLSVADLVTGYPKLSALRLQELAETQNAGDQLTRARLFAQSSEIWLSANQLDEAQTTLDNAFQLAPDAGELYLLSGSVNVAKQRWQPTIQAITKAEELGFFTSQGYTARGRAYKELTQFNDSAEDVARALSLDAFNLDALVLRGELAQTGITINTRFRKTPQ